MGCDNTQASKSEIEHSVIDDAVIHDAAPTYKTVEWTDLMPKSDLDALLNPPEYLDDIADGSFEDIISNQVVNAISSANDDRYQQALISTNIITKMVDQPIRIPGFIVPLEFDDQQNITQFFLVPYFGACIHMPPPPPNQMIFVSSSLGISSNDLYDPFWITGILKTAIIENELGTAAYTMQITTIERYTEEE
ncbi:DUF3299 domain-containing protein [Shewanella frigidimarina]|uniref:DUF3299 domain-containing protein n=1 Tax=Shewanella frigidimarina TaxID=56812 RepID=UPI0009E7C30F|nr:DUF3299 domain-containing protein [Shewanella frigidimarina]